MEREVNSSVTNVTITGSFERFYLMCGREKIDCETARHGYELWAAKTWLLVTKMVIEGALVYTVSLEVTLLFSCKCVPNKYVTCCNPSLM